MLPSFPTISYADLTSSCRPSLASLALMPHLHLSVVNLYNTLLTTAPCDPNGMGFVVKVDNIKCEYGINPIF